jgi:hypothetical protein
VRFATLVTVCLLARTAPGVECAPIKGAGLALQRIDARIRLDYVRRALDEEARRMRIWSWTWVSLYGTATVVQASVIPIYEPDARVEAYVGSASSAFGVVVLAVAPHKVMRDQRWLDARLRHLTDGEHVCAALADAERLLLRDVRDEEFGKSAVVHVGSFLFNGGLGLLLSLGFDRFRAAAITTASGVVVGEIQIWSQPNNLREDLERYRIAHFAPVAAVARARWILLPSTSPGYGLSLSGTFR